MDDRELIENMEAIRQAIDWIEKKEQLVLKEALDDKSYEENLKVWKNL